MKVVAIVTPDWGNFEQHNIIDDIARFEHQHTSFLKPYFVVFEVFFDSHLFLQLSNVGMSLLSIAHTNEDAVQWGVRDVRGIAFGSQYIIHAYSY